MKKIFAIVSLCLCGCGGKMHDQAPEADSLTTDVITVTTGQFQASGIELGKIGPRKIVGSIDVNGKLDVPPQNLVTIAAPMGGFVRSTVLLQGMRVKKGAVLATLENESYVLLQQEYLDHYSKLEYLQAEYQRQQELAKENVNAQKTLQQAKSQFESTRAIVNGLEARLAIINVSPVELRRGKISSTIHLYAPIDGFVTAVNVNIGQFVNATDVLFKIVNLDHMHAELVVYEKDIDKVEVGQKVTFQLANGTVCYPASVALVGKEISPERTVNVHCHLEKTDKSFLPGMFVTASVGVTSREVDAVPVGAIANFEGRDFIFVPSGYNRFKAVSVRQGASDGGFTEVELPPGVATGTPVVIHGAFELMGLLKNKQE